MPHRLLYQNEGEQLVPELSLVVAEPEVPFSIFLKGSLESRVRVIKLDNKSCKG